MIKSGKKGSKDEKQKSDVIIGFFLFLIASHKVCRARGEEKRQAEGFLVVETNTWGYPAKNVSCVGRATFGPSPQALAPASRANVVGVTLAVRAVRRGQGVPVGRLGSNYTFLCHRTATFFGYM